MPSLYSNFLRALVCNQDKTRRGKTERLSQQGNKGREIQKGEDKAKKKKKTLQVSEEEGVGCFVSAGSE